MSEGTGETPERTTISRRDFLAVGSGALTAAAFTGGSEAQMIQQNGQTLGWGKILNGKVAVVTGAARGIGRAAAIGMAESGADIVGIDICAVVDPRSGVEPATQAELEETGKQVTAAGVRWKSIVLDQRDLPALRQAAADVEKQFGHIDILFANAGIQPFRPLFDIEDPDLTI